MLQITKIKIEGTQSRTALNENTVTEYCDALLAGTGFPPVIVFFDGADYWLADGFHRFMAHCRAKFEQINAEVHNGSKRDAILYSVGANYDHGLRRTNADKRKSVMMLLEDSEWCMWSDNEISKKCRVTQPFVSGIRKELKSEPIEERIVERKGAQYTQKTENIGKKNNKKEYDFSLKVERQEEPVPEGCELPVYENREQELEQQVRELADALEVYSKAFNDLSNDGKENYISEVKKLRQEVEYLTERRNILQNELNTANKQIRYLENKLKKQS